MVIFLRVTNKMINQSLSVFREKREKKKTRRENKEMKEIGVETDS